MDDISRSTLRHEIQVYERLGDHEGIIRCNCFPDYGIELACARQGDLEDYIQANPEPQDKSKIDWILSLTKALSYVHS